MPESMHRQLAEHLRVVDALRDQVELLERMADRIIATFEAGGKVYIFGNGGSAADSQHIAAELMGRFKRNRKPLPAIALTTDTSVLTAVANDLGSEQSFSRQVEGLATGRDVVWALSVSGKSANIIRALEAARAAGALRLGFTGRTGQRMKDLCDLCLLADDESSDRVQEAHQLAYHLICDRIDRHYAQ